jgi:hypothetical protein
MRLFLTKIRPHPRLKLLPLKSKVTVDQELLQRLLDVTPRALTRLPNIVALVGLGLGLGHGQIRPPRQLSNHLGTTDEAPRVALDDFERSRPLKRRSQQVPVGDGGFKGSLQHRMSEVLLMASKNFSLVW